MRAEADAIAPVARAVEVLPFEGVAVDGGASTELVECAVPTRMVFAWQLMDADPRGELDLSDAVVVLDEVCRTGDADWTRSLIQRAGRVYDKATIDMQLFIRHEEKKVRRAGGRTRGPAAFTSEDRARFKRNLTELLR